MARPGKIEVKSKPAKAKKTTTKKIKDSFLVIGKRYHFQIYNSPGCWGKLLNVNKNELLVEVEADEDDELAGQTTISKEYVISASEHKALGLLSLERRMVTIHAG